MPAPAEVLGERLGALARGAVDDAALALVAGEELGDLRGAAGPSARSASAMFGRSKQCRKTRGRPSNSALDDVLARRRVGGRREGERLDVAERRARAARSRGIRGGNRAPIARRNAPRRWRAAVTPASRSRAAKPSAGSRSGETKSRRSSLRRRSRQASSRLVLAGRRVEGRGGDAEAAHLLHLVAHQRDQRRDDDGERAVDDRRQLVAHRLAAAGRHDGEHVLAGEHGGDDLGLAGAEIVVAEDRIRAPRARLAALSQRRRPRAAGGRRACRRAGRGGSACPCGRSDQTSTAMARLRERQRGGEPEPQVQAPERGPVHQPIEGEAGEERPVEDEVADRGGAEARPHAVAVDDAQAKQALAERRSVKPWAATT